MKRRFIVVGDSSERGGVVLPYEGHPTSMISGCRIALVGGRVFCEACKSIGLFGQNDKYTKMSQSVVVYLAGLLIMSAPVGVAACSPIKGLGVLFENNSSIISPSEMVKLSKWTAWLRKNYPERESIELEVNAETQEENAEQLGRARELAVRLALIDLDFTAPEFYPAEHVRIQPPVWSAFYGGMETRSVWIVFLPGCPHECQCQADWKLKSK